MEKVRITEEEAHSKFIEGDFDTLEMELDRINSQASELGKSQTSQYFYLEDKNIILFEIYWDNELVYELTFG